MARAVCGLAPGAALLLLGVVFSGVWCLRPEGPQPLLPPRRSQDLGMDGSAGVAPRGGLHREGWKTHHPRAAAQLLVLQLEQQREVGGGDAQRVLPVHRQVGALAAGGHPSGRVRLGCSSRGNKTTGLASAMGSKGLLSSFP